MRIAVTGASGHIGTCICQSLVKKGHEVRALVHEHDQGIKNLPIKYVRGGVLDPAAMRALTRNAHAIIHLAAVLTIKSRNRKVMQVNAEGTRIALNASRKNNVRRFIHFSTIHTFNPRPLDTPLDESRECITQSPYDYDTSKIQSEAFVQEAGKNGLETVILNPTAVMGPYDYKPSTLGQAIIRFYRGQNPAMIPGGYDWVDVRDVARTTINALTKGTPGEKYIVSGNWISIEDLAAEITQLGGAPKPALTAPYWLARLGAPFLNMAATLKGREPIYTALSLETVKNSHRMISSAKAKRDLGHNPRPFHETLTDTIDWFKSIEMIR